MIEGLIGPETLRRWVARASTLEERLDGGFEPHEVASDNASLRLGKWCEIAAKGDGDRFRQTLQLAGLSEPDVLPLLGQTKLRCSTPLPGWAERLPRILELIEKGSGNCPSEPTFGEPFVHLFLPLGRGLHDGIITRCQRWRWSDSAIEDLARGFTCRIVPLFASVLESWFERFRAVMGPRTGGARTDPHGAPTTLIYNAYIDWLRNGHLLRLFEKRPVLARLLAVVAEQWEQFVLELVSRLDADFPAIVAHFFDRRDPGQVLRLQLNNSDPHNRGRCVAILQFSCGERLVYKPRDLSTERAWGALCGWLKAMDAPYEFPTTKVWCGQGYGWVSYVDAAPCSDEAEGRAFFRRAGGLLSLIYVLGGTDFHNENVVAAGAYPIPIDLETILRPGNRANNGSQELHPVLFTAQQLVANSVLASGYLPGWHEFRGKLWAVGGLSDLEVTQDVSVGFQHINSDAMCRGPVPLPQPPRKHLPHLHGVPLYPADYVAEIECGFRQMSRFLLNHRHVFAHGPLAAFRDTVIRLVCRETRLYKLLEQRALQPPGLADGLDFSLEFEFLWRFHDPPDHASSIQVQSERRAMERLDVPLFQMRADSTLVTEISGGTFALACEGKDVLSPFQHALTRLCTLDEPDIERQCTFIRFALGSGQRKPPNPTRWSEQPIAVWSSSAAIERAVSLGAWIMQKAVVRANGAAWIGAVAVGLDERIQLNPLGYDLYNGAGGIAIFLAALYRVTRQTVFRNFCLKALSPLRRALAKDSHARSFGRMMGIGGATGLGSIVYVLVLTAGLAELPQLLGDGRRAARLFTTGLIDSDSVFDVIGGAAGAILGLLALHKTGDRLALEKAVACGRHLVKHNRPGSAAEGTPKLELAGFSHGAAGIAYALQKLAEASGEKTFRTAGAEWIAYERGLFDQKAGNWLDLRFQSKEAPRPEFFACNWCHGAAGIGLARLGGYGTDDDGDTKAEIECAVARAIEEPSSQRDNLCCGNFGRFELLFYAGSQLLRPRLVALARERAAIRLRETVSGFRWPMGTDAENLGFFQGLAGIGYELLRLTEPDKIPCALLWQS